MTRIIQIACSEKHLPQVGYDSELDIWVLREMNEANRAQWITIWDSLQKREENDPFLGRMVTGDEKWIVYNNAKCERS